MTQRQDAYQGVNDSHTTPSQYYDALNRPTMVENTYAPGGVFRSWYQYDNVGREVATWRDEDSSKGNRYWYNETNQVTNVRYNADQVWTGQPQNPQHSVDYNYTPDRLNRLSVVDNGAVINFDANGMNQYVGIGGQTVQYDQNFNVSLLSGWSYGYDAEKHLMVTSNGGSSASFVYDGLGRCVKRTINGVSTRLVYDGWKPIMELSPETNHLVAWNIYGPAADEILWRWVEGVGDMRYQHDIHGNVTALLGFYGGVIERYTYDVFGSPTILSVKNTQLSASAFGNRFMFQGREYFPELGTQTCLS
jgi:hypothetical protein